MRISLINPIYPQNERRTINSALGASLDMPPLGILYIATVLEQNKHDVQVVDMNLYLSKDDRGMIIKKILDFGPKVIGMSVCTPSFNHAVELVSIFKNKVKHIIWGGYHATFRPSEALEYADVVIKGEGEYAFLEIIKSISKNGIDNKKLKRIKGISFKINGKKIHNPPDILRIENLDCIPFPNRRLLPMNNYKVPFTIIGSRGCVARCQFCAAGAWGGIRLRSPQNIVDELIQLKNEYRYSHVCFIDNTFTSSKSRTLELVELIRKNNLNMTFSLETRATNVDQELIKALKSMGTTTVQFGVETGSNEVMHSIKKEITVDNVINAVKLCVNNGLNVMCSFIIGHPADTKKTIDETVSLAKQIKKIGGQAKLEMLTPYPGTDLYNYSKELGLEITDWNFSNWGSSQPVFRTRTFSSKELSRLFMNSVMEVNVV